MDHFPRLRVKITKIFDFCNLLWGEFSPENERNSTGNQWLENGISYWNGPFSGDISIFGDFKDMFKLRWWYCWCFFNVMKIHWHVDMSMVAFDTTLLMEPHISAINSLIWCGWKQSRVNRKIDPRPSNVTFIGVNQPKTTRRPSMELTYFHISSLISIFPYIAQT